MKRATHTASVVALVALGAMGCQTLASTQEYRLYRAYRYLAAGPERLAAGSAYIEAHPQGRFSAEVRREVETAEEDFWMEHRASVDGLSGYVQAFPRGSHVEEARQRLAVFEAARREQVAATQATEQAERERREEELRLTGARARIWGRTNFDRWVRLFGGLQGWGQGFGPIVGANASFREAFENAPPQCRAAHCRKDFTQDFYISVPGRSALPRRLNLQLDMVRAGSDRVVNQVYVNLRARGLTQWFESERQEPVAADEAQAREAAVRWSMDQLRAVFGAAFPEARETPASLYGPPPEPMVMGAEEEEEAPPPAPADANACPIPSQPLGVRWTAVIGCTGLANPRPFTVPDEARTAHTAAMEPAGGVGPAVTANACLRVDAYAALDGEGMGTDEGIVLTLIPACALTPAAPARPARPGARPAAAPARPAAAPARPAPTP